MDIITHIKPPKIFVSKDKDSPPPENGANQQEASVGDAKSPTHRTLPVVITTEVVSKDECTSQLAINDRGEAAPLNSGSLTPSGPPNSYHQFSPQDFTRSFYSKWIKDKSIEKSNPFGFHSANTSNNPSRSTSPTPMSYTQSLTRKGTLSGG